MYFELEFKRTMQNFLTIIVIVYHCYRAITSADRSVAAPGAVFKTQPPGEAVQLEIAIALVERSRSVIRGVRR